MPSQIRVTTWNEYLHEKASTDVAAVYPKGIHGAIGDGLREQLGDAVTVRSATLEEPEHGLTEEVLAETDVLTWWGHMGHARVSDEIVTRVQKRVLDGMGLLVLHSGHMSKIFIRLMGTSCTLNWRDDDVEHVWNVSPGHPIAEGLPPVFTIPNQEMYGEFFDIPQPDEQVFISSFDGGEVFRSGCCFRRGKGRIFYFSPGHETFPVYHQPEVRRVLANAVRWAHQPTVSSLDLSKAPNRELNWFRK